MSNDTMMQAALEYANQGLAVFPLFPRDKFPIYKGGFQNATTDPVQIGKWWRKNPDANIGIATGQMSGGVFAIDLDVDENKGVNGYETVMDWQRDNGELPDTAGTITGRGGYHWLYRANGPIKTRAKLLPGIDIRGDGGYIVAPPSVHPNGIPYQWEQTIDEFGIANANATVMALLSVGERPQGETFIVPDKIGAGERNDTLYRMACSLQAKAYADESIRATIEAENRVRCEPPLDDSELEKIITSALKWPKGTAKTAITTPNGCGSDISIDGMLQKIKTRKRDDNGQMAIVYKNKQSSDNMAIVMRNDPIVAGKIRYDEVACAPKYFGQLEWRKDGDTMGDWTDFDDAKLRAHLDTAYNLRGSDIYSDAFEMVMGENTFNPIIDYLEALPPWDGVERIKYLLPRYLGADECEYTEAVTKLFMLGALSRAYHPGCKFDYMLVLVGDQGVGKSGFLRKLAINDMWFDDNLNTVEGKEAVEKLRGKWILELAELMALKKQKDVESVKAFITTQSDSYREPYARRTSDRKRFCVFAATTNDFSFLTDRTGNRRFLPIEVKKKSDNIPLFGSHTVESEVRDYINKAWAEALHIFNANNKRPELILSPSMQDEAIARQLNYLEEDAQTGIIQNWLDKTLMQQICVMDIWTKALEEIGRPKRAESNRIHAIMRNEITGWRCIGRQRTEEYGNQICYVREWVEVENDDGF